MKESTKVFCWDFNGTLEEGSEIALTEAINEILANRGIERRVSTRDVFGFFGGTIEKLAKEVSGMDISREELEGLTFSKAEQYVKPVEGAKEVLSEVRERGDMNVVVSGAGQHVLARYLEMTGLMPYVNAHFGIDSFNIMHSKMGLDHELNYRVEVEKVRALFQYADHRYVDRVVMIGDSHADIRSAAITNELLHRRGIRKKIRPILFKPPHREERIINQSLQKLWDNVFYHMIAHKKAKTLREAMEMGYEEETKMSIIRKYPFSTSTALLGGIGTLYAGVDLIKGNEYWYFPFLFASPFLPFLGIFSRKFEKQIEKYREESIRSKKS